MPLDKELQTIPRDLSKATLSETIDSTKDDLSSIQQELINVLELIDNNQSTVSVVAKHWNEVPNWQRIAAGLALSAPLVALIPVASIPTLFALTTTSMILDEHHQVTSNTVDKVKAIVVNLASVLQMTITALNTISKKFNEELEKFKEQNRTLNDTISQLSDDVASLNNQLMAVGAATVFLKANIQELEEEIQQFKAADDQQKAQLEEVKQKLVRVQADYKQSQEYLSTKLAEVNEAKEKLSKEISTANDTTNLLRTTLDKLVGPMLGDAAQRNKFKEKLDHFVENNNASFKDLADKMSKTEKELQDAKDELQRSNREHCEQLARLKEQNDRLEKVVTQIETDRNERVASVNEIISGGHMFFKIPPRGVDAQCPMAPACV